MHTQRVLMLHCNLFQLLPDLAPGSPQLICFLFYSIQKTEDQKMVTDSVHVSADPSMLTPVQRSPWETSFSQLEVEGESTVF